MKLFENTSGNTFVVNSDIVKFNNAERFALDNKSKRITLTDTETGSTLSYVATPTGAFVLSVDTPKNYRRQGGATRLMNSLKQKFNTIWLDAHSSDDGGLSQQQLIAWYTKKLEFVSIDGNKMKFSKTI